MKLFRFGKVGEEKPGLITTDDEWLDVSSFGEDYTESFFGSDGVNRLKNWFNSNEENCLTIKPDVRIAPCIARPSKIICIGLNYVNHAKETKAEIPSEPIIFLKSTTALCGPYDDVIIPKNSTKTDWEVELAVVIGKRTSYVTEKNALDYVAGYSLHNDYSERAFQLERGGQWVKGKSCDTFAPVGPYLVTKDEILDCNNLQMWLKVNGEVKQKESTSDMIFKVPFLISYVSQFMTLLPGDLISTGTPAGVGLGCVPPVYLKDGDVVELFMEGLGHQKQKLVSYISN